MKKNLTNITNNLTPFKLVIYSFLFLEVFIVIPYLFLISYLNIKTGGLDLSNESTVKTLFLAVIFGPMLETLIFQTFIINLVKKIVPKLPFLAIIISGGLFGLSHFYSFAYIIYTTLIGVVLAYIYVLSQNKKFNPFLIVFSIHALINLMMFFVFV